MKQYAMFNTNVNILIKLMGEKHPDKEWYITTDMWKDGDYLITIIHSDSTPIPNSNRSTYPLTRYEYSIDTRKEGIIFETRLIKNHNSYLSSCGEVISNEIIS